MRSRRISATVPISISAANYSNRFPVSALPRSPAFARRIQSLPQGFTDAKQVAAFSGLAPAVRQSGTWVGQTRISKSGDPILRKVLYMPALSAWTHNPVIRAFCLRLKDNGKNGKAIVCAAMRKLICLSPSQSSNPASLSTHFTQAQNNP
ncbi:MAG: transposase [Methylococcales bacterium]